MLYVLGFISLNCISLTMPEGDPFNMNLKIKLLKVFLRECTFCVYMYTYLHVYTGI